VKQSIFCLGFPERPRAKMTVKHNGFCIEILDFIAFGQNQENVILLMVFLLIL